MAISSTSSALETLGKKLNHSWSGIEGARAAAAQEHEKLRELIEKEGGEMRPDMGFIVFGSLARREWTSGSDVDWSLLVDGQTDPEDIHIAKRIQDILSENGYPKPGPSGVFGSLAFSHSLVHEIGGPSDSHVNTTRRVLLLLESRGIGDATVRDRVIRALLSRYLEEDTHFIPQMVRVLSFRVFC